MRRSPGVTIAMLYTMNYEVLPSLEWGPETTLCPEYVFRTQIGYLGPGSTEFV
jgi:hypothetical protein